VARRALLVLPGFERSEVAGAGEQHLGRVAGRSSPAATAASTYCGRQATGSRSSSSATKRRPVAGIAPAAEQDLFDDLVPIVGGHGPGDDDAVAGEAEPADDAVDEIG
jgi:hypothetical protein